MDRSSRRTGAALYLADTAAESADRRLARERVFSCQSEIGMQRGTKVIIGNDLITTVPRVLLPPHRWSAIAGALALSGRELDVVQSILEGQDDESTARALGISIHTVHTHTDRLHRKLHVSNRAELILRIFAEYVALTEEGEGRRPNADPVAPDNPRAAS